MSNLGRLACVALVVTEVGAFLPAPGGISLGSMRGKHQSPWGSEIAARTCFEVQPARAGGLLSAQQQHQHRQQQQGQRRCCRDGRSRALYAKKKGKNDGRKQREDEEDEITEEMKAFREAKLAEWKAQIKSGEVRFAPLIILLLAADAAATAAAAAATAAAARVPPGLHRREARSLLSCFLFALCSGLPTGLVVLLSVVSVITENGELVSWLDTISCIALRHQATNHQVLGICVHVCSYNTRVLLLYRYVRTTRSVNETIMVRYR